MKTGLLFVVLGLTYSSAATAAGFWIDDKGRSLQMSAPSPTPISLEPNGHSVQDAALAFKQICIDSSVGKDAAVMIASETSWGFNYKPDIVPFKDPVDIGGWISKDAILNVSDGLFFNKFPQCNLQVKTSDRFDDVSLRTAVTAVLGWEPHNIAKATKKNGSPNSGYQPEWIVTLQNGASATVFSRSSVGDASIVHLAVLKKEPKK